MSIQQGTGLSELHNAVMNLLGDVKIVVDAMSGLNPQQNNIMIMLFRSFEYISEAPILTEKLEIFLQTEVCYMTKPVCLTSGRDFHVDHLMSLRHFDLQIFIMFIMCV